MGAYIGVLIWHYQMMQSRQRSSVWQTVDICFLDGLSPLIISSVSGKLFGLLPSTISLLSKSWCSSITYFVAEQVLVCGKQLFLCYVNVGKRKS